MTDQPQPNTPPSIFYCQNLNDSDQWLDLAAWKNEAGEALGESLLQRLLENEDFSIAIDAALLPDYLQSSSALWLAYPLLQTEYLSAALQAMVPALQPALGWWLAVEPLPESQRYALHYTKGNQHINTAFDSQAAPADASAMDLLLQWSQQRNLATEGLGSCQALSTEKSDANWIRTLIAIAAKSVDINTNQDSNDDASDAPDVLANDVEPLETTTAAPIAPDPIAIPNLPTRSLGKAWKTAIPALELSSEQNHAAHALYQGKSLVIQGGADTGKTHWLASLLPALWADGASVLLVSPSGAPIGDLSYHLEQLGMKDLGILTLLEEDNLEKDRLLAFLDKLPQLTKNTQNPDQAISYKKQWHTYHRHRSELDAIANHLQTEISTGKTWADMVGTFLLEHKKTGRHLLHRALRDMEFVYSESEYIAVSEELQGHYPFFAAIQTLEHPLNMLHEVVFEQPLQQAQQRLSQFLESNLQRGKELLNLFLALIEEYAFSLKSGYDDYADGLRRQAESVLYALELYIDIYGDGMERSGVMLRVMGVFSGHHRDVLAAKDSLYQAYQKVEESYNQYKYFEAKLPNIRQTPLREVADKLRAFLLELQRWQGRTPKWVEQKVQEWTTALPVKIEFKRQLEDAERQLQQWLLDLRSSQVFQRSFDTRGTQVLHRPDVLRDALAYLAEAQRQMPAFDKFFAWRGHWLGLSERSRLVVRALVAAQASDWQSAFASWYIYQWLGRNAGHYRSEQNLPLEDFVKNHALLRNSIAQHALGECRQRQSQILQQWKKEGKQWRAAYQAQSLFDLLQGIGLESLRLAFPLVIASPEWAGRLTNLQGKAWDLVVVESAEELDSVAMVPVLQKANQRAVLGLPLDEAQHAGLSLLSLCLKNSDGYRPHLFSRIYSKDSRSNHHLPLHHPTSLFADAVFAYLAAYFNVERLERDVRCDVVLIDIVIKPIHKNAAPIAILCDGWCKMPTWTDYGMALFQKQTLEARGYVMRYAWSDEWWRSPEKAAQALIAFVVHWDRQFMPRQ